MGTLPRHCTPTHQRRHALRFPYVKSPRSNNGNTNMVPCILIASLLPRSSSMAGRCPVRIPPRPQWLWLSSGPHVAPPAAIPMLREETFRAPFVAQPPLVEELYLVYFDNKEWSTTSLPGFTRGEGQHGGAVRFEIKVLDNRRASRSGLRSLRASGSLVPELLK
ncbi:hypothetical protein MTO96_029261 [Rhipicephalus appendiculatus]